MRPDVHRDPDRLHQHAVTAAGVSDALVAALLRAGRPDDASGRTPDDLSPDDLSPDDLAELERLDTAVRRAVAELTELAESLRSAARGATQADADAARGFR